MSTFSRTNLFIALVALACLMMSPAFNPPVVAQVTTGSISGTVTDVTGAIVAGAEVTITDVETNVSRTAKTNSVGLYLVPDLPVGKYQATVRMSGFETVKKTGIVLTVGAASVQNVTLKVGSTSEMVQVEADVAQVETTNSELSALVDERQMRELPLNGRNYQQLILLAPGVQTVTTGGQSSQYGRAPAYSNAGMRPEGEAILLDGTSITNFWNHGSGASVLGTSLGVEAIGEFQLLIGTYSAEFGGAGLAMNSVSKSGTNAFHGSLYEFLRNSDLDAKNYFDRATMSIPPFKRNQFGGSFGGPIRKDSTFFFVNYEGLRQRLSETGITAVPDANARQGIINGHNYGPVNPAIQALLNFWPLPTPGTDNPVTGTGEYYSIGQNPVNEDYLLARIDHKIGPKDSFFGRFVRDRGNYQDPFDQSSRGGYIPNWPELDNTHNYYTTLEERRTQGTNLINVARYSYVRTDQGSSVSTNDPLYPASLNVYGPGSPDAGVVVTGLGGIGPYATNPFFYIQNKHTGEDQIYWTRGSHDLRLGGSFTRLLTDLSMPLYPGSSWSFTSLQNLLIDNVYSVSGPLPGYTNSKRAYNEWDFALYFQDNWKLSPKLTLNLGVRYEPTTIAVPGDKNTVLATIINVSDPGPTIVPQVLANNPSLKNIDPRVGLSYAPFGDSKTVVRLGFGMFHEIITPAQYSGSYNTFWPGYASMGQTATKAVPISFPNLFPGASLTADGVPSGSGVAQLSTSTAMPYLTTNTPYVMQWNLNVQRQIGSGLVVTAAYVGTRGDHLYVNRDWNPVVTEIQPDGSYLFKGFPGAGVRLNPEYAFLSRCTPAAMSDYNGLQLSATGRITKSLQLQLYYTWSKALDDSSNSTTGENSNGTNQQTNPYNINYDYGPSAYNRTNNFTGNLMYDLPFHGNRLVSGYQVSMIPALRSGPAYSADTGYDSAGLNDSLIFERPNVVGDPNKAGPVAANPKCVAPASIHNPTTWFNPCAFMIPAAGTLGNEGRGALVGPALIDFDMALSKSIAITERLKLQFRAEAFNIFNRPNFALPSQNVYSASGAVVATAGQIVQTVTTSRQLQFGLKFLF
jgi:type 1 fimbria pilin